MIIHELLHNTSYIGGHADFDESFANFVGNRGAMAFFAARGDTAAVQQATSVWEDTLLFSEFLGRFAAHLRDAYAAGLSAPEREQLFSGGTGGVPPSRLAHDTVLRRFGTQPLNNAVILHHLLYADRLREFDDAAATGGRTTWRAR